MGWTIESRTEPAIPGTTAAARRVIWVGCLLLTLGPGFAMGLNSADGDEIDIRFFNGAARTINIEPFSGWPLTLHLTANEEKLQGLNGGALEALHSKGQLQNVYMLLASLPRLSWLIERKNELLAGD